MAWDQGLRRIILEVDSVDAVRSIKNLDRRSLCHSLVACAVELLGRNWKVRICYVSWCVNSVAGGLAKLAEPVSVEVVVYADPPWSISHALQQDALSCRLNAS
ncbi:hypothetical protein V6N13_137770 [Hibiscus sabdariffa]|uniref:RNase H type-1 domain-containing protein n=1 Tax=Hibiscus sabdariffa TaxID=183260 RepID=A0ABR2DJM9_9ROSI